MQLRGNIDNGPIPSEETEPNVLKYPNHYILFFVKIVETRNQNFECFPFTMFQPTGEHSKAEEWTEDTGQTTKLATPRREGDLTRQHKRYITCSR